MLVSKLAAHVSPARLLADFPTALTAEAHFDAASNARLAVVLTFPHGQPPAMRSSKALGCVLQPVVNPPEGAGATRKVVWHRKDGKVRQRTETSETTSAAQPAATTPTSATGRGLWRP